jgi:hypothetical protein
MPDWQHLNADPRSEYASNIDPVEIALSSPVRHSFV